MNKTLKKLSIEHQYYCSDSNYFNADCSEEFETMTDFLEEYKTADIDMNLIFRFDIRGVETGHYSAEVFIIHQRKGIFKPIIINSITEKEAVEFEKLLKNHWKKLVELWKPISK